jgi:hypothetical protein
MQMLLTTLILWLSANFGLPATADHPHIIYESPAKITALRYGGIPEHTSANAQSSHRQVISIYNPATKTIYLPKEWAGQTPAELSVLVHELVHHLQEIQKQKFSCPQEREQLAYEAQDRWLRMFGSDLSKEFEIDPFTIIVLSTCMY